jgi:hypothetical protein
MLHIMRVPWIISIRPPDRHIPVSDVGAVDAAVASARAATTEWRATPPTRRRKILENLAALILKNGDELAALSMLENGVNMGFGATRFPVMAADSARYYAGWADKLDRLVVDLHVTSRWSIQSINLLGSRASPPGTCQPCRSHSLFGDIRASQLRPRLRFAAPPSGSARRV